jgi:hypothetical protein
MPVGSGSRSRRCSSGRLPDHRERRRRAPKSRERDDRLEGQRHEAPLGESLCAGRLPSRSARCSGVVADGTGPRNPDPRRREDRHRRKPPYDKPLNVADSVGLRPPTRSSPRSSLTSPR